MAELYQVDYNRTTLWVFQYSGDTVGRFSTRFGMDVHRTSKEMREGMGECIHCTHTKPSRADWDQFRALIQQHYNIEIPEDAIDVTQLRRCI